MLSQSRGRDSSGVARLGPGEITVIKESVPAEKLLKQDDVRRALDESGTDAWISVGHSRMETNGSFRFGCNNQPVLKERALVIHNGIIVNDAKFWETHPALHREADVDTETIAAIFDTAFADSAKVGTIGAELRALKGSFSIAVVPVSRDFLLLATNTGSLYFHLDAKAGFFSFASEKRFLVDALGADAAIDQLRADESLTVSLRDLSTDRVPYAALPSQLVTQSVAGTSAARKVSVASHDPAVPPPPTPAQVTARKLRDAELDRLVNQGFNVAREKARRLHRCTRCIRPETIPYISFDAKGVCNFCYIHNPKPHMGKDALLKAVEPYRRKKGELEAIVAFSGGRDSAYALHYVVKELGLKVAAFSYDWGMLTDLGRRNQARLTGALGVEHVLVAADIQKKRSFVRMNVEAWLKKPDLGMIPLFMAGDKQYFHNLNLLRGRMNVPLLIYADHPLETTYFKYGFAGVNFVPKPDQKKDYDMGLANKLRVLAYYGSQYLKNPGYINASLWDSFTAYLSYYGAPKDYLYLFRYIPWIEKTVEDTIIGQYDWELSTDTKSSWRIGDGTASFYNYIYYVVRGLTEHDTFRSNQINAGLITRDEALRLVEEGHEPRVESIAWYCDTIGIDPVAAIKRINEIPTFQPSGPQIAMSSRPSPSISP